MQSLTRQLIGFDSVTGNESGITNFLVPHLEQRGMRVATFEVDNSRHNLLATWQDASPSILFNTHIDTVPEQYGPYEDAERIYGRGACDTHGVLAAQLEALSDLHQEGFSRSGILIVVGEETNHDGAIHAGNCIGIEQPEVLIVGEPTENKLMTSQKGRLKAELTVYGLAGHSGYPEKFDSAVEKLCYFLQTLWRAPWLAKDSMHGTTVNTIIRESGSADNQVPGLASARLMFRCAEACDIIKKKLSKSLAEANARIPAAVELETHFTLKWDAASNDPITNLATVPGFATGVAAYNTDIPYLGWPETQTFLLGPGSILQAHRDLFNDSWLQGEWIRKDDQIKGVELYKRLVKELYRVHGFQ